MVNPNDPAAIPYVISEDDGALWYVAYREKSPGIPYITVSAKGVANGLSTEYNDGYDFGPDSYNPGVSSGIPVTQSGGLLEAWNYAVSVSYTFPTSGGTYVMPMLKIVGSPIIINTNITLSGNGKLLETPIISGESSMMPFIVCNINSGYAITFDPSSFSYVNIRIENLQPQVGTGYTPEGAISLPYGTTGVVFEAYNINISNGGWTGDPLSLYAQWVYMWNYETYVGAGNSSGAFYIRDIMTIMTGNLTLGSIIKFSGFDWAGTASNPNIYLSGMGTSGTSEQGVIFNLDTVESLVIDCPSLAVGGINFSDTAATNAGSSFSSFNVDLRNVSISTLTTTSIFSASASSPQTLQNLSVKAINTILSNSPATTVNLFSNISVSNRLILELEPIQLNGNTLIRPDQSTTAGTTAGTVEMRFTEYSPIYKKLIISLSNYENDTTTNQTIDFPLPFSFSAVLSANNTGLGVTANNTSITITAPDSTATYRGLMIFEGY